jgi:hypothetical protein
MGTNANDRGATARQAKRRRFIWIAAAIGVTCLISGGTIAIASSASAGDQNRVNTIHIVTTLTSNAINSAGFGGPGDVVAQVFTFEVSPGVTGHIAASSTKDSNSEQLSHVAFVFPDGQIDAQAAITLPPSHFVAAVIGGTEAYEGVGGEVVNNVISTSPLTIDRTLYLIYPNGD